MANNMRRLWRLTPVLASAVLASASQAAVYQATAANLASVIAGAVGGDTIVLNGTFPETSLRNLNYAVPLLLDARKAQFPAGISIRDSNGISIRGGSFGSPTQLPRIGRGIDVNGGGNIRIDGSAFVGVAGVGTGVLARNATRVAITRSSFTSLKLGAGFLSVNSSSLTSNIVTNSSSDGFNVAGSTNVIVSGNTCRDGTPSLGAHPDCVQLWSLVGAPMQSNIRILNNMAYGATQGFTSFDPDTASGRTLTFEGNHLETSYPQGIACYGCFSSIVRNNTLITLPDARWRTSMNVVGGSGNTITGNVLFDNRVAARDEDVPPPATADNLLADIDLLSPDGADFAGATLAIDGNAFGPITNDGLNGDFAQPGAAMMRGMAFGSFSAAVPEPASWALWISGFGLLGLALRRRAPAFG